MFEGLGKPATAASMTMTRIPLAVWRMCAPTRPRRSRTRCRAGQSLQAYVRQLLEREAATITPEEAAEQARVIAARSSVTADDVVDAIAEMRAARA